MNKSMPESFWGRVDKSKGPDDCWLWLFGKGRGGYGKVTYQGKTWSTHRLAATLCGMDITNLMVCHRCDTPACCNPKHLFTGIAADNSSDMVSKGRQARHLKTRSGKLTELDVAEIIRRAIAGEAYAYIAADYGVSGASIARWGKLHEIHRGTSRGIARKRKNISSGVAGVSWHTRDHRWQAAVRTNGKQVYIGSFINMEEAIDAQRAWLEGEQHE